MMHRLKVFGGLSIETDGGPLTGRAAQRRRLALLVLLATASAGLTRDKIIAYLWPDADTENGRRFLSDSVYRINQALGSDVIVAAGDELRLDPDRLPSDAAEFAEAMADGDHERAASLYQGPFLDGFFLSDAPELEHWIEAERSRFARDLAAALEALARDASSNGRHAEATAWWRRLAALDPYSSRIALGFMQALDATGERAAAIRHARIHETLLREELETGPDEAVQKLAQALRSQGRTGIVGSSGAGAGGAERPVVAPPTDRPGTAAVTSHDSPPAQPPSAIRHVVPVRLLAGALALVLGGTALWLGPRGSAGSAAETPPRSVAVLPFASLSPDPADQYFSDGITEELIGTLAQVPELQVASRTSSFAYKGETVDVRKVGEQLGVDAVIEGSVRKADGTLRIATRLVSTADGYTLWSREYDRELNDVFAIQEEIAGALVATLTGRAAEAAHVELGSHPPRDPEAYDLYLKGRFAWHKRTREGLLRAIEYFEQAVALAPDYARAYVGLGDAYAVGAFYDYVAPRTAYPRAERAARRALEITPDVAAPHATLGYVFTYYHLDWPRAEDAFQRALSIDPAYSTSHQWYANLLTVAGRFDEAEREMRLAQESDPLSLIANAALGWSFLLAGRPEDALEQCRRTLALAPDFELAHLWSGWALEAMGRRDEARQAIGRAVSLSGGSVLTRLALAHVLAGSGSAARDSAIAIAREVEDRAADGEYVPSYEIAKVHLALGARATAMRWLERAAEERSHSMAYLLVDPQLAALRGDPSFERLAARIRR